MKNIYLVGFMGTGKTTVGRILAEKLSKDFVEMDEVIEEKEGKRIKDIFKDHGEPYFRKLENNLLKEIILQSDLVVSCGGGVVCDQSNLKLLQDTGRVFSLFASPAVIFKRVKDSSQRPLLNVEDPLAKINELLQFRQPFYKKAGVEINTDNLSSLQVADYILRLLKNG